ncbi:MAG: hypothetical protein Q8O82_10310 [Pseudorhodobacter sp.]|nr:hypothetical protein [Pseudorhodobacter sp.]
MKKFMVPYDQAAEHIERALGLANAFYEMLIGESEQQTDSFHARLTLMLFIVENMRAATECHQAEWDAVVPSLAA